MLEHLAVRFELLGDQRTCDIARLLRALARIAGDPPDDDYDDDDEESATAVEDAPLPGE
jgi:hypothetical protein